MNTATNTATPIVIYVGAHQTEQLAFAVLEYSIRRHASLPVTLRRVDNSLAPPPPDARFLPYTHFSYGRFAIPKLNGYRGRAIYLDSDMLVFRDIAELWDTPFDGAKILIEQGSRDSGDRTRFTAVMLLDCAALAWDPAEIVGRLGHDYDYDELMSLAPLLAPGELAERLPRGWNSLDELHPQTRLLHYTKLKTQPWVYPAHPLGQHWVDTLREMLACGAIDAAAVRTEVARGHVRPSLLAELGLSPDGPASTGRSAARPARHDPQWLLALDRKAGFVVHRELFAALEQKRSARQQSERELDPAGFYRRRRRRRLRSLIRHPLRFFLDPALRR